MRFYTKPHQAYGGIALHARRMSVCLLSQDGEILRHRNIQTSPETWLKAMAPYWEELVVAVDCSLTWDLARRPLRPGPDAFVLGHALSMNAIHGGKATHDKIDSHKIAVLLRGGMLPQASVSPAERRATRDFLRRRMYLTRQRAEMLAHMQHTNSQDHRPEIGKKLAYKANRAGVAARFPAPAVHKRMEVDLGLIGYDDQGLNDLE
jgi:hypothetical protein